MLRVTLVGNVGADPELRYTAKGTQIASFNVAVNQVRFGTDGERQENTEWFRIRLSGRQVEFVQQRVGKGGRVLVMGRLDISHYQGKDGEQRTGFDVWAEEVQLMSAPRSIGPEVESETESEAAEPALAGVSSTRGASSNGRSRAPSRGEAASSSNAGAGGGDDLEDLPF
jgi:single-strand DNA-binding protein